MKKNLYSILSTLLAMSMIFSVFGIAAVAEAAAEENTYYVINGGTGDGKSESTPASSVAAAIEQMQADGLDEAENTVKIYIMQRPDWKAAGVGTVSKDNPLPHGMTYWSEDGAVPEHKAAVIIEGYGETTDTYRLASNPIAGKNLGLKLGGTTVFKNVELVGTRIFEQGIELAGHSATLETDVTYGYINRDENRTQAWDGNTGNNNTLYTSIGFPTDTKTVTEEVNIVFNNVVAPSDAKKYIYISNYRTGKYTFDENVNITLNNAASDAVISFGNGDSGTTVFNKNLNFNIKSASSVTFIDGAADLTVTGGIQVIKGSGVALNGNPETFSGVTAGGIWYLTDNSGVSDLLSFTDVTGTYAVRPGFGAKAVAEDGTEYTSLNGTLTVPAGEYTIESIAEPKSMNYYVMNGGTGDGTSAESPVATVYDAVVKMNEDGLGAQDTANIYIMQRSDFNTYDGTVNPRDELHLTAWTAEGGSVPKHSAKMIVRSYDGNSSTCLAYSGILGTGDLKLSGPVQFENLTIVCTNGMNNSFVIGTYDVEFGTNVFFKKIDSKTYTGSVKIDDQAALYFQTGATENTAAVGKEVSVVFNNYIRFVNNGTDKRKLNLGLRDTQTVFKDDYKIVINNPMAIATVTLSDIYSGNTTFEKNLSIYAKSAATVSLYQNNSLTVNGAFQVLLNPGINYTGDILNFTNVTALGGKWIVKCAVEDAVTLTETQGTYKVKDGFYAIAEDSQGNRTISKDGLLTLAPDKEYTVSLLENLYKNEGDKITVFADTEIDLSGETPAYKENSVFVGWKNSTGEFVDRVSVQKEGEVLTPEYTDFNEDDFILEEAQIRTDDELGLRFIIKQNKEFMSGLPTVVDYGTLNLPVDTSNGRTMYLDEPIAIERAPKSSNVNEFEIKTAGEIPTKVRGTNTLEETETERRYTLCLTGIEEEKYDVFYTARGYIKYKTYNGVDYVIYSNDCTASLYKVAAEAVANGESNAVYTEIKDYVENVLKPSYLESLENGGIEYLSGYEGNTDTNPNHKIFRYKANGLVVSDVTIDSGKENNPQSQILFFSDIHVPYIDREDMERGIITSLSSYRGRSWLRDGSSIKRIPNIMKYASLMDATVVGGDILDYFSFGSQSVVRNSIAAKSINGNLLMAYGNHDAKEQSQPDISGLTDIFSKEEHYEILNKFWPYNSANGMSVIKSADGENSAVFAMLDCQDGTYTAGQAAFLHSAIERAEELDLPLLIAQHCPMVTYNPAETAVHYGGTYDNSRYGIETDATIDFTSSGELAGGGSNDDAETMSVINLIRSNPDVVKGVFTGHFHANIYTEIIAVDQNGDTLYGNDGKPVVIPQYTVGAAATGSVMRITVK